MSTAVRRLQWPSQRVRCAMRTPEQDVSGHSWKRGEDLTGDDVSGHGVRWHVDTGPEVEGHIARLDGAEMQGEDVEGHVVRVRFEKMDPSDDVEGHGIRFKFLDQTGNDVEGHRVRFHEDMTGEDTEGHAITAKFVDQSDDDGDVHITIAWDPDGPEVQGHLFKVRY